MREGERRREKAREGERRREKEGDGRRREKAREGRHGEADHREARLEDRRREKVREGGRWEKVREGETRPITVKPVSTTVTVSLSTARSLGSHSTMYLRHAISMQSACNSSS